MPRIVALGMSRSEIDYLKPLRQCPVFCSSTSELQWAIYNPFANRRHSNGPHVQFG